MKRLRVALFGSPAFALPTLEALAARHELVLVVSQPDKPAGRGLKSRPSAVSHRANELDLELWHPRKLRSDEPFLERLRAAALDVAVTAAYGRILPDAVLEAPRHGVLNVHASLLPAYRGAAPVQWALIDGREQSGVTIMQTEAGLDTGPIRLQRAVDIGPDETAPELLERLAPLGAQTLLEALELLAADALPSTPQDDAAATLAPLLVASDGHLRWSDDAHSIYDRFRGVAAWPGSSFAYEGARVKVTAMRPVAREPAPDDSSRSTAGSAPGTVLAVSGDELLVATGQGPTDGGGHALRLLSVKPPGGREMSASAWANGRRLKVGDRLG